MFTEQKVAVEVSVVQENPEKYHLFFSTAHPDSHDEQSGTGDVDYTQALADTINSQKFVRQKACYIRGIFDEKVIYKYIKEHAANRSPILHVMINAPRTGFAFTVEGLTRFKQLGGQLVVTAVEFAKHRYHPEPAALQYQRTTLEYLKIADQIIFLDEIDKDAAIAFQQTHFSGDRLLLNKLQTAKVISVPPTIPPLVDTPPQGGDIISFGMIRVGKGLAHVIKLARLISETEEPQMSHKKILVVGTVQPHVENRPFADILCALYPEKVAEISSFVLVDGHQKFKTGVALKALWEQYKREGLVPALPIELHIDVPISDLAPLFQRCTYAYLPAYRGVTLRNSSISSAIAQCFVTYSHIDEITPSDLRPEGAYHNALVLMQGENYHTYANEVFADLLKRESEPEATSNLQTKQNAKRLLGEALSRDLIGNRHCGIYQRLAISAKVAPLAFHWQSVVHKKRAYGIMQKMQGFDIQQRGDQNFKALLKRLKMGDGSHTSEMHELLQAKKAPDAVLTREERKFFSNMLKRDWVLKHVTDSTSMEKMKENGSMLSLEERTHRGMDQRFPLKVHVNNR